jgi:nicotinate-nucleotide adenylyltransferase
LQTALHSGAGGTDAYASGMSNPPDGGTASERGGTDDLPSRPARIGILGGTFDPPHCGHVAAALECRTALALDRVLLVVANEPWQKVPQRNVTPAEDRYAMVEAAVAGLQGVEASRMEIDRGGPSYTADTVAGILADTARAGHPRPELYLVVGADLVESLPTWKRVEELRSEVTLAVVSRPGTKPVEAPDWRSVMVHGDAVDVSSSEVRDRLERGEPLDDLVPEAVVRCIRRRGLYAVGR